MFRSLRKSLLNPFGKKTTSDYEDALMRAPKTDQSDLLIQEFAFLKHKTFLKKKEQFN